MDEIRFSGSAVESNRNMWRHCRAQIGKSGGHRIVLDLEEVKLVDRHVVRFLGVCESQGIELRHCAPYIREWILREKARDGWPQ
jgi:hypothetical protein